MITASVGRIVHYVLNDVDVANINSQRSAGSGKSGNSPVEGQHYAAILVCTWEGATSANLQVFLDGNDTYWATSRSQNDDAVQGSWHQPEQVS